MSHEQRAQRLLGIQRYTQQGSRAEVDADLSAWRGLANAAGPVRTRRLWYGSLSIIGGIAVGWLLAMEARGDPVAFFAPVALGIGLSVYFFLKAKQANVGEEAFRLELADHLLRSIAFDDASPLKCVVDLSDDEAEHKITRTKDHGLLASKTDSDLKDLWFSLEGTLQGGPSLKISRADLIYRTYEHTGNGGSRSTWQFWHSDSIEITYDPSQYPRLATTGITLSPGMTGGIKEHSPGRLIIEASSPRSGKRTKTLDTLRQLIISSLGLFGVAGKWLSTTPLRETNQEAYEAGRRTFGAPSAPKPGRKFLYASLASFAVAGLLGLLGYEDLERAQFRREWAASDRAAAARAQPGDIYSRAELLQRAAQSDKSAQEVYNDAILSIVAALALGGLGAFFIKKSRQER